MLGPGDQLLAQLFVGGVEGDRQVQGQVFFGELAHFRGDSNRGNRDLPGADVEAFGIVNDADGLEDVGIIGQRLPHAHEDNVGNALLDGPQNAVEQKDLLNDFSGGEILLLAIEPAGAELTTNWATDLRTDAGGAARAVGNHDGLGRGIGFGANEELFGAVGGALTIEDFAQDETEMFVERLAVWGTEIGHFRRLGQELAINPLADLDATKARPAPFLQQRIELGGSKIENVNFIRD